MSEYLDITRIRPVSTSAASSERRPPGASGANHDSPANGVTAAAALGCLIIGLQVEGVTTRHT
ncbi:hypothetical protein [Nesterenkonia sandarakina]|uniref:Uncharacterized protein n=1 Tax=Nesterenkonia sandarakina TaxID=272918 RepID=A0A2T0YIT0_9MICC|nr:hypothetical protein [Nesterenkonia sandarakina]PRZ15105.1 hypothetical protein BCL67_10925 [Nesterenkonia sandarakina]